MDAATLFQKKGELVGLPPAGQVAYFTDSSGNLKQVDSAGNVTTVGGGSGAVHVIAPITGDGTVGNPLAIVIPPCAEDAWGANAAAFVATKATTVTNVVFRSRCANALTQELSAATVSGSGAVAQNTSAVGGVISTTTGTTASSRAYFTNAGKLTYVPNLRTAKYAVVTRAKIISVNATCTLILGDATDTSTSDNYFGVLGATSTANYVFIVGAVTQNTAVAIDNSYHTIAMIADGTNVSLWNVDTGVQIGTNIAQSNAATVAGHFRFDMLNGTTTTAVAADIDDAMFITEQAA